VEASALLSWGGASAAAALAVARWRPTSGGRPRVRREPIELDLVYEHLIEREVAMEGETRGDRAMATTMPTSGETTSGTNGATAAPTPPTGVPIEQMYTWLEWVQDDLRRVEARLEYLEAARGQLREQERLLSELLQSSAPLAR
jgi:hypothetical protein